MLCEAREKPVGKCDQKAPEENAQAQTAQAAEATTPQEVVASRLWSVSRQEVADF
jgi:hypothetical protein